MSLMVIDHAPDEFVEVCLVMVVELVKVVTVLLCLARPDSVRAWGRLILLGTLTVGDKMMPLIVTVVPAIAATEKLIVRVLLPLESVA